MTGDFYHYYCDCGVEIRAETWDPHELPRLWCPDCGEVMDLNKGDLAND